MEAVIARGADAAGIRLVQDAANAQSLSLYASMGFDVREPLALMEGTLSATPAAGVEVRPLASRDVDGCAALGEVVHGFSRAGELRAVPPFLTSWVAVRDGRVVAYASAPHFWQMNQAVAEELVPTRHAALFRWLLAHGLRVVKPMTLMVMGAYEEPRGAWLPSVGY
jgi:hypothetical protein